MTFTSRHKNGQHSSRPEKDLIFALPHFLKGKKIKKCHRSIFCHGFCATLRLAHLQVKFFNA